MKAVILLSTLLPSLTGARYGVPAFPLLFAITALAQEQDDVAECEGWASSGECTLNPQYMMQNCPIACKRMAESDKEMAQAIGEFCCVAVHELYYKCVYTYIISCG